MPDFTGFPRETFTFLADLEANNSADWFAANRSRYEDHVLTPALAFIEALRPRIEGIAPGYHAEAQLNGSFRRMNRDVRFSKDKTPYSPRIHLVFWTGDHPLRSPAVHLAIHPRRFGYGAGEWGWPPERVEAFRARLEDPAALAALREALAAAAAVGCEMGEPALKRPPKGYAPDHPAGDLLRYKSLVARTRNDPPLPAGIGSAAFVDTCAEVVRGLSPLNLWLKNNLN